MRDVVGDSSHDALAEPLALMFRQNGDIDDLIGRSAVTDEPAHADDFTVKLDRDAEDGIGQAPRRRFGRFGAEPEARRKWQ